MLVKNGKFAMPKELETVMRMAAKTSRRNGYTTCFATFHDGEIHQLHLFGFEDGEVSDDVITAPGEDGWDRFKHIQEDAT